MCRILLFGEILCACVRVYVCVYMRRGNRVLKARKVVQEYIRIRCCKEQCKK